MGFIPRRREYVTLRKIERFPVLLAALSGNMEIGACTALRTGGVIGCELIDSVNGSDVFGVLACSAEKDLWAEACECCS